MKFFALILTDLRAAIAARAARDQAVTLLLVAVWGRIARMGTRLERLIALWRAGKLPPPRPARAGRVRARGAAPRQRFPNRRAWLIAHVRDAVPFGTQLAHALTDAECQAFLAAVPQAGRILRPLLHMLGVDPMPQVVRRARQAVPAPMSERAVAGVVVGPVAQFLPG